MEKKLPKVFANKIDKDLKNNEKVYYNRGEEKVEEQKKEVPKKETKIESMSSKLNVQQKINKIFSSSRYVYKADVDITLKDGKISKRIIGRNRNGLITMDNELINIADIIDIEFSDN